MFFNPCKALIYRELRRVERNVKSAKRNVKSAKRNVKSVKRNVKSTEGEEGRGESTPAGSVEASSWDVLKIADFKPVERLFPFLG